MCSNLNTKIRTNLNLKIWESFLEIGRTLPWNSLILPMPQPDTCPLMVNANYWDVISQSLLLLIKQKGLDNIFEDW